MHNCIEYMYQLSDEKIMLKDVPEHIRDFGAVNPRIDFSLDKRKETVLAAVAKFNSDGQPAGRKNLHDNLLTNGCKIAEQDIRFILKNLEGMGLVEVNKGRRGTEITAAGLQYLKHRRL